MHIKPLFKQLLSLSVTHSFLHRFPSENFGWSSSSNFLLSPSSVLSTFLSSPFSLSLSSVLPLSLPFSLSPSLPFYLPSSHLRFSDTTCQECSLCVYFHHLITLFRTSAPGVITDFSSTHSSLLLFHVLCCSISSLPLKFPVRTVLSCSYLFYDIISTPVEYRELDSSCFINISTALNLLMRVYPTHRLFFLSLSSSLSLFLSLSHTQTLSHSAFATNVGQNLSPPRIICSIVTTTLFSSSSRMKKREEERVLKERERKREIEKGRERVLKESGKISPSSSNEEPSTAHLWSDRSNRTWLHHTVHWFQLFPLSNSFHSQTLSPLEHFSLSLLPTFFYPKFCGKNVSRKNETFRLLFI